MTGNSYKALAERLDALPNGFPPTADGVELRLLAHIFTPEEAALAAQLRLTLETPDQLAARLGGDAAALRKQLKEMTRRGLIAAGRTDAGLGYKLMPFAVGIYEMQVQTIDAEFARLFEDYYHQAFGAMVAVAPQLHRVVPVEQSVRVDMEVRPFESAADIVAHAKSWGVMDCLCRKQQALIGHPCKHPVDVCMVFSDTAGAFDQSSAVRALTQEGALDTLRRAAEAGLVHSVSNNQQGAWYICNCCTCACGILRGLVDLGLANVIARSAFVNQVDDDVCIGCGACVEKCQFGALTVDGIAHVDALRCVGCGVCTVACPVGALRMIRRPDADIAPPPATEREWMSARAAARGLDLNAVL